MTQARSPQQVFLALANAVADGRFDELPSRYAEQADVIHPSDPVRAPALRSRDEFREASGRREKSGPPRPGRRSAARSPTSSSTRQPI
jgi:hypothetical protein